MISRKKGMFTTMKFLEEKFSMVNEKNKFFVKSFFRTDSP